MTEHIEEGRLQAWLDGELPTGERGAVAAHLASCSACRAVHRELEAVQADTTEALGMLDVRAPDVDGALWEVRRRRARRRSGGHRRGMAAAAAVVLLVGGGAALAMPGSPLRSWIDAGSDPGSPSAPVPEVRTEADEGAALGVTVDLLDGSIEVAFLEAPPGMVLEVEPTSERRAGVFAPPASRFRTAPGRVEVRVSGPGEILRVRVPSSARGAEIRVNGEVVARVRDGDLILPTGAARDTLDARVRVRIPGSDSPPMGDG